MGFGGSGPVKGYDYYFTIHMGISRGPVDEIVEIKAGDRVIYPIEPEWDVIYDNVIEGSSNLGGTIFPDENILGDVGGVSCIAIALPYNVNNPPWVPGQRITMVNFTRHIYEEVTPIDVSGTYEMSPRFGNDPDRLSRLWIWIPLVDAPTWGSYIGSGEIVVDGPPPALVTAIDFSTPVPPPIDNYRITTNKPVYINAYEVFGGRDKEGGILGWFMPMFGEPDQMPEFYLTAMLGPGLSGFRGMLTAVFKGIVAAGNPYPKPWSFRVRRRLKGWDGDVWHPELATINLSREIGPADEAILHPSFGRPAGMISAIHAYNPVHMIYECLTNREWGRGLPRAALDDASFLAAATTIFNEGFGLCLRWTRTDEIASFVKFILEHIGGAIYQDRRTAKIIVKLIRADYDINTIPFFDTDNGLLSITDSAVGAVPDLVNEIVVTFIDPLSGKDATVRAQNIASIQSSNGQFVSLTKDYPGLPTNELARRVALRDLKAYGSGLRRFTVTCDRRAWNVTPGSVIKIQNEPRGILPMAVRVGPVKYGTLLNGDITIECTQDVFAMPTASFVGEQPNLWQPPSTKPCVGLWFLHEMPYFLLAGQLTPAEFAEVTPGSARVFTVHEQGKPLNAAYEIATRGSASTIDDVPPTDDWAC